MNHQRIDLEVIDSNGTKQCLFKLHTTTKMSTVMKNYCIRWGLGIESTSFHYGNAILHGDNTPQDLNMKNMDVIVAYVFY